MPTNNTFTITFRRTPWLWIFGLVLVAFKLTGNSDLSWFWTTFPLWISLAVGIAAWAIVMAFYGLFLVFIGIVGPLGERFIGAQQKRRRARLDIED